MSRGVWISNPFLLIALGFGVFAIVFAVAHREIRESFNDLFRKD